MIQLWSAIAVALLTVVIGPLLSGEVSGRMFKRITAHAELRENLTGNEAALQELDALLVTELATLRSREQHRLTRKLNGGTVAALILVAGVGGGVVYGLVAIAVALTNSLLAVAIVLYVVAAAVGLLTVCLAAVGVGTLYEPSKSPEERAAARAERAARRKG